MLETLGSKKRALILIILFFAAIICLFVLGRVLNYFLLKNRLIYMDCRVTYLLQIFPEPLSREDAAKNFFEKYDYLFYGCEPAKGLIFSNCSKETNTKIMKGLEGESFDCLISQLQCKKPGIPDEILVKYEILHKDNFYYIRVEGLGPCYDENASIQEIILGGRKKYIIVKEPPNLVYELERIYLEQKYGSK